MREPDREVVILLLNLLAVLLAAIIVFGISYIVVGAL